VDGDENVLIRAHVENWSDGTNRVQILDNERLLTVVSAHGSPLPGVGSHTNTLGERLTNTVNAFDVEGGARYVCAGWLMTGQTDTNGLSTGSAARMVMVHTNNAVLRWAWTTNYWLATTNEGSGAVTPPSGWFAARTNVTAFAEADPYYHFLLWLGSATGHIVSGSVSSSPVAVAVDSPMELIGEFAENLATNGTPEWWLAAHGFTNRDWDVEAMDDQDGDGMETWKEYDADTVPLDPESLLRMLGVSGTEGGYLVTWQGGTDALQFLDWRDDLRGSNGRWDTLFTNVPPTSSPDGTVDGVHTAGFYRVRVPPRP
jgi:hypothetical protein